MSLSDLRYGAVNKFDPLAEPDTLIAISHLQDLERNNA